jgi:hypothetical protein
VGSARREEEALSLLNRDRSRPAVQRVLVIADHEFDPRLRRKIRWIEERFPDVTLCRHGRAEWFRASGFPGDRRVIDYDDDRALLGFEGGLCYVSGAKVLWEKRGVLSRLRRKNRIVFEVPDLPLRTRSSMINWVISKGFSFMFGRVVDAGVITAPAFVERLPSGLKYFLSENCPQGDIAEALHELKAPCRPKAPGQPFHIGFVGAIRYGEQIRLLLRYAARRDNVVIHFFGGPVERLEGILEEERKDSGELNPAQLCVHGPFDFEQSICRIYGELDILYAVYDARQPNVRMALPNKLYEAALAQRAILAAEGTAFAEVVLEGGIGEALPFELSQYPRFEARLDAFLQEGWDRTSRPDFAEKVMIRCQQQKQAFGAFLAEVATRP